MKNVIIIIYSILLMSLVSCEKPELTKEEKATDTASQMAGKGSGIYAMHINNGIDCNCINNILVFPNWETFRATTEALEIQRDVNVTEFASNAPIGLSDEDFEIYSDSQNFREEQPYLDFEATYQFASLRKMIYDQETDWLASLGEFEVWDMEKDPSNHYIWYENQVLLNEQAEVIVKDSLGKDVIYKFYEGGHLEIRDNDYKLLTQLNTTTEPVISSKLLYYVGGPCEVIYGQPNPWDNFPFPCDGYSGGGGGGGPAPEPTCKTSNDIRKSFGTSGGTKIKTVDKFKHNIFFGNDKVKCKTEYYRWHDAPWPFTGGAWVRGKTTLTATLVSNFALNCNGNGQGPLPNSKTEKASKVKVEWSGNDLAGSPEVIDNAIYGTHKRRQDVTKTIDHYDGDIIP